MSGVTYIIAESADLPPGGKERQGEGNRERERERESGWEEGGFFRFLLAR
jgi:hypothetical protein